VHPPDEKDVYCGFYVNQLFVPPECSHDREQLVEVRGLIDLLPTIPTGDGTPVF
jgi:hypothetical protein